MRWLCEPKISALPCHETPVGVRILLLEPGVTPGRPAGGFLGGRAPGDPAREPEAWHYNTAYVGAFDRQASLLGFWKQ